MTLPPDALQDLLLDLISTRRDVDVELVSSLTEKDWASILSMVRQHRLGPLLHWRLTHERAGVPVPEHVREVLASSFKRGTLRALALQRELVSIGRILDGARIPWAALKGAYLAFNVYPHPALRPLRDLDVLVSREQALAAYRALKDGGYRAADCYQGDPETSIAETKHLPALLSPGDRVTVEVHARLLSPGNEQTGDTEEAGIWERVIERRIAGVPIPYLSPADLLLFLTVHSLFEHRLDNGPLVLTDIGYLVRRAEIDWALFWSAAEARGWTRACLLLLAMTQQYLGPLPIDVPTSLSSEMEEAAVFTPVCAALTLRDFDSRLDVRLTVALADKPMKEKLSYLWSSAFPSKVHLATLHPAAPDSRAIYFYYASNCVRLLTRRVPEFLMKRGHATVTTEARRLAELDSWLVPR